MGTYMVPSDNSYSDEEILALIEARDQRTLASEAIRAESFLAIACQATAQAFGAFALADDDAALWVYPDASWSVGEKPERPEVSFAPMADYPTRESLAARLLFNARRCAVCSRRAVEHVDSNPEACIEYAAAV